MICGKCQTAGQWNKAANAMPTDEPERHGYVDLAKEFHRQCEFPNCMCQHKVGHYVAQ